MTVKAASIPSAGSGAALGIGTGAQPKALQLVQQLADNGEYKLCESAVAELAAMGKCPIAVLAIAGVAREGKSYILNRLVETAERFKVSPLVKPCTHGIWMVSKAITINGKKHELVVLDTEGIASMEQTAHTSSSMVAMAGLLSSLLIYNQSKAINEDCVKDLGHAARTLDNLMNQTGDSSEAKQPVCSAPELLLLVRDADLDIESTPSEHLESYLGDLPLSGSDISGIMARNSVRNVIKTVFPRRSCLTLERPCLDSSRLESTPKEEINPKFEQGVAELKNYVFGTIRPKTFKNAPMAGPLLVQLLSAAVTVANKPDGVLNSGSMWTAMIEVELKAATEAANNAYETSSKTLTPSRTPEEATDTYKVAMQAAQEAFGQKITFADASSRLTAWVALEAQLLAAHTAQLSRLERQLAEQAAGITRLMAEAREQALLMLNRSGLLAELEKLSVTDLYPAKVKVQERASAAWKRFDAVVAKGQVGTKQLPEHLAKHTQKMLETAEAAVAGAITLAATEAEQRAKAALAEKQARAAAAEKAQLEEEKRLDEQQKLALKAAVQEYKQDMDGWLYGAKNWTEADLKAKHKTKVQLLHINAKNLPQQRADMLWIDISRQCGDLFEGGLAVLMQQRQAENGKILMQATDSALQAYKADVRDVGVRYTDSAQAKRSSQVARQRACATFELLAAQQSTYQRDSPEYIKAQGRLIKDIEVQEYQVLNDVRRNAQAEQERVRIWQEQEAARRRLEEAAAAERRLQAQTEADRARLEAERRAQEARAAELQREQAKREERQRQAERRCMAEYASRCHEDNFYSFGPAVIMNPYSYFGFGVPLTTRGLPCKICLRGYGCPYH